MSNNQNIIKGNMAKIVGFFMLNYHYFIAFFVFQIFKFMLDTQIFEFSANMIIVGHI